MFNRHLQRAHALAKPSQRTFSVMNPAVADHLVKLGITNKNIVYNPR